MYAARVAAFMALAGSGGAKVIWVGMPPMQDGELSAKMDDLNTLVQQQGGVGQAAGQLHQHLGSCSATRPAPTLALHHQRRRPGDQRPQIPTAPT